MIVSLHPEADEELIAAAVHYARHASRRVAADFLDQFDRAIALLQEYPRLGTPWRGEVRRFPLRRFPYSVVYSETAERLRVVAVAHQHRRPGYWRDRS
jgi:plasmid stabilization system protein ParE